MKWIIFLFATFTIFSFCAEAEGIKKNPNIILFLGDSLTAGHGLLEPELKAYPALFEAKAKNAGLSVKVINGGMSGATTAGALNRSKWFTRNQIDMCVIALGANDGLRGISVKESRKNLEELIEGLQKQNIKIYLVGMLLPWNYGNEYRKEFESLYLELQKKYSLPFLPFLLKNVAGVSSLNQGDQIHPNEKGHELMAQTLFDFLRPYL